MENFREFKAAMMKKDIIENGIKTFENGKAIDKNFRNYQTDVIETFLDNMAYTVYDCYSRNDDFEDMDMVVNIYNSVGFLDMQFVLLATK